MANNLVRKISAKSVIGNIQKIIKEYNHGDVVELFAVAGAAHGARTGNTQYGDWVGFEGTFEAVNLLDGSVYNAKECFLPEPYSSALHEGIKNALADAVNNGGEMKEVEFAIKVKVEISVDENGDRDYMYLGESLMDMEQTSRLNHLRTLLPKFDPSKSIEAPKEEKTAKKK